MSIASPSVERVFKALSDGTRRGVLERLGHGSASVSELAEPYDMALPSFVQHLQLLEASGLVRSRKTGRIRTYELAGRQLRLAEDWLSRQRSLWERRLDRLDAYVTDFKENDQ